MSDMHIEDECLDDAERFILKRLLVNYLMRRDKVCPVCLEDLHKNPNKALI